jgi:predicted acylesterase/phospholipase RssA
MRSRPRIGLALAGGGPLGAVYEIGALCALEDSIAGLDLARCDAYVGVSAGSFIAAGLANGLRPRELCASFIENTGAAHDIFEPSVLMQPAWGEYARRLVSLPPLIAQAVYGYAFKRRSFGSVIERLGRALPTGLLSNRRLEEQLRAQFSRPGRSNDFRTLSRKLVLVATELDSGTSTPFGRPGLDHVPISVAVQASSALPGLYPPVPIDGRHYVDGALKKTLHASVLLEDGLDLLFCVNPLVPFDASAAARRDGRHHLDPVPRLVEGGLPAVLSQTFRTLIHSRLEIGMKSYEHSHPGTDIVLLEPERDDPEFFFTNPFSYSQRRRLAEHAFQRTREVLRHRRVSIGAKLARHGLQFETGRLDDRARVLIEGAAPPPRVDPARQLGQVLDRLAAALEALPQPR